ncbi:MAG: class A beta-lactamase-related serine hydrolase [Planctomycetota bacterium]|nr:MAG: class A beta-lactamase-related serine hydrolase [Planctomycetota bacterium]
MLLLFHLLALQAEPVAERTQRLQAVLEAWHQGASFPGATAGFADADGRCFGLAVGVSDRERKTPMQAADRMLAGSVGKTYVAAVALQLVHEGRLGLDEPIAKYLGQEAWFPRLPNAADIRVRMLLQHTSGLVRYEFHEKFVQDLKSEPYKVWKPEEQLAYLFDSEAPFAAGAGWDYSDSNYLVLGLILERIGGAPLNEQIRARVLEPLRLADTLPSDRPELPGLVQGYAGPDNPFGDADAVLADGRMVFNPQFEWAGGGYYTTAPDLARWARLFYQGEAFAAALLPQVVDGVEAPMLGPGVRYGLCAILRDSALGPVWGHSGFFPGYVTEMAYYPERRCAVAVQVNSSAPRVLGRPLRRVVDELAAVLSAP